MAIEIEQAKETTNDLIGLLQIGCSLNPNGYTDNAAVAIYLHTLLEKAEEIQLYLKEKTMM